MSKKRATEKFDLSLRVVHASEGQVKYHGSTILDNGRAPTTDVRPTLMSEIFAIWSEIRRAMPQLCTTIASQATGSQAAHPAQP
jgi:hypothetical protein